jgi:hypothetical protein
VLIESGGLTFAHGRAKSLNPLIQAKVCKMSSGPSTFRKVDVKRAALSAAAGGIEIGRIDISKDGVISIYPKDKTAPTNAPTNEWDEPVAKTNPPVRS